MPFFAKLVELANADHNATWFIHDVVAAIACRPMESIVCLDLADRLAIYAGTPGNLALARTVRQQRLYRDW